MTPVNFTSFLLSLALVDMHYTLARLHNHAEAPGRLPSWLHGLLFRPQPYRAAYAPGRGTRAGAAPYEWHYHSNQRGLMEMEAADAFRIRTAVLVVLGVAVMGAAWAAWCLAGRLYRCWVP